MGKKYWLMKSEPETYSIDRFKKDKKTLWEGVRNYQARNFMTKEMNIGDEFIFYHSNATPPGAIGIGEISKKALPDPSAFDKKSPYFDEKSSTDNPRWHCVEVAFKEKFKRLVPLSEVREVKALSKMLLIKKGMRLSIQPVTRQEFEILKKMGNSVQ